MIIMNTDAPTYEIHQLTDFSTVPIDRLDACLADFKQWVLCHRVLKTYGLEEGYKVSMTWTDDGKVGLDHITFKITDNDTKE